MMYYGSRKWFPFGTQELVHDKVGDESLFDEYSDEYGSGF